MSIINCIYKQGNICTQSNENIKDIEKRLNWKCCESCNWQNPVYTKQDKKRLINDLHKELSISNDYNHILDMKFVYGHYIQSRGDYDEIAYKVCIIRLIELKKYTKLSDCEFCFGVWLMKQMHYKLPCFVNKRYKRKLKTINKEMYNYMIKYYFTQL